MQRHVGCQVKEISRGLDVRVAAAQDGVFTRSQARSEGWSDGRQRRLVRSGLWVPITASVLRHREAVEGPWQRARAVWLTGGMVVSHDTAGQLWGLCTSGGLHGTSLSSRRTTAVITHRADLPSADTVAVDGMRVTTPPRTVADLLCTLEPPASVAMACDALRQGILTTAELRRAADSATGRHGAARARFVARTCAGRPYSVLEWHFHRRVGALGPGWRFNPAVHDCGGQDRRRRRAARRHEDRRRARWAAVPRTGPVPGRPYARPATGRGRLRRPALHVGRPDQAPGRRHRAHPTNGGPPCSPRSLNALRCMSASIGSQTQRRSVSGEARRNATQAGAAAGSGWNRTVGPPGRPTTMGA